MTVRIRAGVEDDGEVLRDIENVKAIQSAAAEFRTLIDTVLSELT